MLLGIIFQSVVMTNNENNKTAFFPQQKSTTVKKYHSVVQKHCFLSNNNAGDENVGLWNCSSFRRLHNNNQQDDVIFYSGSLNQKIPKLRPSKTLSTSRVSESPLPKIQSKGPKALKPTPKASRSQSKSAVVGRGRCSKQDRVCQQGEDFISATSVGGSCNKSSTIMVGKRQFNQNFSRLQEEMVITAAAQSTTTRIIQSCRHEREVDASRMVDVWDMKISGGGEKSHSEIGRFRRTVDKTIRRQTANDHGPRRVSLAGNEELMNKNELGRNSPHNGNDQQNENDLNWRIHCFMLLTGKPLMKTPPTPTTTRKLHNSRKISQLYATVNTAVASFNNPLEFRKDGFVNAGNHTEAVTRRKTSQQQIRRVSVVSANQNRRNSVSTNRIRRNSVSASQNRKISASANQNRKHSFSANQARTRSSSTNQKAGIFFVTNRKNVVEVTTSDSYLNYYNKESGDKSRYLRYPSSPILSTDEIFR